MQENDELKIATASLTQNITGESKKELLKQKALLERWNETISASISSIQSMMNRMSTSLSNRSTFLEESSSVLNQEAFEAATEALNEMRKVSKRTQEKYRSLKNVQEEIQKACKEISILVNRIEHRESKERILKSSRTRDNNTEEFDILDIQEDLKFAKRKIQTADHALDAYKELTE